MVNNLSSYKIHAVNVNSLIRIPKRYFLSQYLKEHNPDFLLLSETCLKTRHKLNFDSYNLIRTDAVPGSRGTAILVKDCYDFRPFKLNFIPSFEYTAISVKTMSSRLYIFSVYIKANQLSSHDDFVKIINKFSNSDPFIFGGDFNAKHTGWKNYNNNPNGIVLNSLLSSNSPLRQIKLISSNSPSRFDAYSYSYIDLFLISENISSDSWASTFDYESDHQAIEIYINLPVLDKCQPTFFSDFNRTTWKNVQNELTNLLELNLPPTNVNLSADEINNYVVFLEKTSLQVVLKNTPQVKIHSKYSLKLNELTLKCIKRKKQFRRRWFADGRKDNLLKSVIKRLDKIIHELITAQYNSKLEKELRQIQPGPDVFKHIRKFSNKPSKQIPILNNCIDDQSSAELLAEHFSSIHNNSSAALATDISCPPNSIVSSLLASPPSSLLNFSDLTSSDGTSITDSNNYNLLISPEQTAKLIKSRKNQKSSAKNQISNFILKKLPQAFILFLTIILNNCLNISYFPSYWKHATVIPIPKGCSPSTDHSLYRPISLLSAMSKILELVIKEKLLNHIHSISASHPYQFGFSQMKSTSHAITFLSENIHSAAGKKLPTLAVSIDLQKAFDTVWINGLIFKLKLLNFPKYLILLIFRFLSGRSFQVKLNNAFSNPFPINAGVPQGSILGPTLFNAYIADFPTYAYINIKTIFFADDIFIFMSKKHIPTAITAMQNYLELILQYLDMWKLTVNYNKCQSILFRKSDAHIPKPYKHFKIPSNLVIRFGNHIIENVSSVKYLGILLDCKLSTIPQVNRIINLANGAYHCLKNIYYKGSSSVSIKSLCYKQLIRPILLYGFPGWCHISSHQMRRLRTFERKILYKSLPFNQSHFLTNDVFKLIPKSSLFNHFVNLPRLDIVLTKHFIKFFERLTFSDLPELSSLTNPSILMEKFSHYDVRFKYKCFPPSFLYFLHFQGRLHVNNLLRFYNRRHNTNTIDDYVYDLIMPT